MSILEVGYGSERHKFFKKAVRDRKEYSKRKMTEHYDRWNEADDIFRAYIPERDVDYKKKQNKKTKGELDYVTVEIPYTYATLMSAHTYWSTVFLSRNPVFQVSGRHGETQENIMGIEAVMDYQRAVGEMSLPLFNWLYDMGKYGVGIMGSYWEEEKITITRIEDVPVTVLGIPISGKKKKQKTTQIIPGYEGNKLYNIRPFDFFPDPRVPFNRFQDGEFCGRDVTVGWHEILEGEAAGNYMNIKALREHLAVGDGDKAGRTATVDLPFGADGNNDEGKDYEGASTVDLHEMVIRLVPKQWKLGSGDRVEKWIFTLANNEVLISVRPLGMYHDKFPYHVQEYMMGNDEFIKRSMADVIQPMSDVVSWLFNSHFYNIRKSLNDVRVVDPSRIVMKDVTSPGPGGVIRLKPAAYGTDPRLALHQLNVTDVTRTHLQDMQNVEQMSQRVSGVMDNIMGMLSPGGRKTATEVRTASGFSTNRLKTVAEYNSALGWQPLVGMLISSTQQLLDSERIYRIAGNTINNESFVTVGPDAIAGFYDYVPVDGTLPIDRLAQANFWKELLMQMSRSPELMMQWNLGEMVAHVMKLQGERNIDRFRIKVRPDDQIDNDRAAGNVVPLGAGAGRNNTGSSGGSI